MFESCFKKLPTQLNTDPVSKNQYSHFFLLTKKINFSKMTEPPTDVCSELGQCWQCKLGLTCDTNPSVTPRKYIPNVENAIQCSTNCELFRYFIYEIEALDCYCFDGCGLEISINDTLHTINNNNSSNNNTISLYYAQSHCQNDDFETYISSAITAAHGAMYVLLLLFLAIRAACMVSYFIFLFCFVFVVRRFNIVKRTYLFYSLSFFFLFFCAFSQTQKSQLFGSVLRFFGNYKIFF